MFVKIPLSSRKVRIDRRKFLAEVIPFGGDIRPQLLTRPQSLFFKNGKTGCLLRLSGGVKREAGDVTVLVPSEAGGRANPGSAPVCLSGMRPGDADPLQ